MHKGWEKLPMEPMRNSMILKAIGFVFDFELWDKKLGLCEWNKTENQMRFFEVR